MSMSKFASQADYWKDRAERAEAKLAKPVILTDEALFQEIEVAGIPVEDVALTCSIKDLVQSSVLRKNGFKVEEGA